MPVLHRHEMSGSFAWNSSIWSLSVDATLSGALSEPSSVSKPFIALKLAFHIPFTSASSASGSIADIGPLSHMYEFFWNSCAVDHSATKGAITLGASSSCTNCERGKPSSSSSPFSASARSVASLIFEVSVLSAIVFSATRSMSPSAEKACACRT